MITTFSHRLCRSVSRLRKLPRSRSPYDHVPYTGSPLPNTSGLVDVVSKPAENRLHRDLHSHDVQRTHRAFGVPQTEPSHSRSLGWMLREAIRNIESRNIFKSSQPWRGSIGNTRLSLSLPREQYRSRQTSFVKTAWQTRNLHESYRRVSQVHGEFNRAAEFPHATGRAIVRSVQTIHAVKLLKAFSLNACTAGGDSHKDLLAERSPRLFRHYDPGHAPRTETTLIHDPYMSRLSIERPAFPFSSQGTRRSISGFVPSKIGNILSPQNLFSTTPELLHSNVGRQVAPRTRWSSESGISAATSNDVSFRGRLKSAAAAISTNTSVASRIAFQTGVKSSQNVLPGDFHRDVSKPGRPAAATTVTTERSRSGSQVIVPRTGNVPGSRSNHQTPNDFEKKRAARMNARPRRMLPRIR